MNYITHKRFFVHLYQPIHWHLGRGCARRGHGVIGAHFAKMTPNFGFLAAFWGSFMNDPLVLNCGEFLSRFKPSVISYIGQVPPSAVPYWVTCSVFSFKSQLMIKNSSHELAKLSSLFSAFRKCLKLQNWYHNVLCFITGMFCVRKFYFMDFNRMFTSSPTWCLKMHIYVLCSLKKYYFLKQNITLPLFHTSKT